MEPPCSATTPIDLAVSIDEPPPSATSPSQPESRKTPTPRSTSAMSGLGRTSSKTKCSPTCSSRRSRSPAATIPESVTTRGRETPKPCSACDSAREADVDGESRAPLTDGRDPFRRHLRVEADLADDVGAELLLLEHRLDRRAVADEGVAVRIPGDSDLRERAPELRQRSQERQ